MEEQAKPEEQNTPDEQQTPEAPESEQLVPPGYAVEFGTGRLVPITAATILANSGSRITNKRIRKRRG